MSSQNEILKIQEEALKAFANAKDLKELYDHKVQFLGKTGSFSKVMQGMKDLPPAEKPLFGSKVNESKKLLEEAYEKFFAELTRKEISAKLANEKIDITLPGPSVPRGTQHPISMVIDEVSSILSKIGYSVRLGPLIETDFNNFFMRFIEF